MSHWYWVCHCCDCPDAVTDEFTRSNSTNINASWTEQVGDFWIDTNTLLCPTDANAVATWSPNPAGNKISFKVTGDTGPEVENDIYRVIVNWLNSSNYHFGEFKIGTGGYIKLKSMISGSESELGTKDVSIVEEDTGGMSVTVCFTEVEFSLTLSGRAEDQIRIDTHTPIAGGYLAGLGSDGTASRFDSFYWIEHYYTNHNCPSCVCWCNDTVIPDTLTWTLTLVSGESPIVACHDGLSTTLTWSAAGDQWTGNANAGPCADCSGLDSSGDNEIDIVMQCAGPNGTGDTTPVGAFQMVLDCTNDIFEFDTGADELTTGESCSPLELVWGPITTGPQCEGYGGQNIWKITVTP